MCDKRLSNYGSVLLTILLFALCFANNIHAQSRDAKETEAMLKQLQNNNETVTPSKPIDATESSEALLKKNIPNSMPNDSTEETLSPKKSEAASNDAVLFKTAIGMFNSGNYDNAAKAFEDIIRENSQSPHADSAKIYRGKIYIKKHEYRKAITELSSITEESGEYPIARYDTAFCLNANGDMVGAISCYQTIAYRFPDHELADDALLQSGILLSKNGKGNEAIAAFLQLSRQYKNRETIDDALYFMGKVFESDPALRDIERARDIYKLFLKKSEQGEQYFKESPLKDRVAKDLKRIEETYFRIQQ